MSTVFWNPCRWTYGNNCSSFACMACKNFSSFTCMAYRKFPWSKCLPNCKKLFRSFYLLWEVCNLLLLVGMPMVMLIMKRFVYVTHIAYSLHDTKSVWKEVDLEFPISLTFWSPKSIHLFIYLKQRLLQNPIYRKKRKNTTNPTYHISFVLWNPCT